MSHIEARFNLPRPGFTLDVDLRLPGGGVTVLFGASGSGKTTLLRCIAGLERASSGRLYFEGLCWQDGRQWVPTHQRDLGYVFQEASLLPHLLVMGNLRFGLKRSAHRSSRWLDQAVDLLGISHLLDRQPQNLSGGERQRVGIARALALGPRLLLMDEPLAALDLQRKQEVMPYLERLHREAAIPILYVTHALDEAARLADHLVLLEAGRVRHEGPAHQLLSRLDTPLAQLDEAAVMVRARIEAHEPAQGLSLLGLGDGPEQRLWVGQHAAAVGAPVRARVLARDVSVSLSRATDTSILNVLPATIEDMQDSGAHSRMLLLRVAPEACLQARLTRRSCEQLGLRVGMPVFAQVKGAALL